MIANRLTFLEDLHVLRSCSRAREGGANSPIAKAVDGVPLNSPHIASMRQQELDLLECLVRINHGMALDNRAHSLRKQMR